jgi:DedD protein
VFSNPDNAKQLIERLHREGVKAYSETRVQVGPFRSREEAEQARLALERLGIRAVIAPQGATR